MIVPSCTTRSTEKSDHIKEYLPPFFDCNKYIGPGFPKSPDFPRASDLLAHMDRLGIDRAVAWHTNARNINPMAGNEQLIDEIEKSFFRERIIPSFIITPTLVNEQVTTDHFLHLVTKHHIRAFQ